MTRSDRTIGRTPSATPMSRPQIWIDGQQRPRFNVAAYAATSLGMAKRDLAPEIADAAQRLDQFAQRVLAGQVRVNTTRLGRLERLVPSHRRVGSWVLALARALHGALAVLNPAAAPPDALAYPDLTRRRPTAAPNPMRPNAVAPVPVPQILPTVEPTLHAIRSILHTAPQDLAPATPLAQPDLPHDRTEPPSGPIGRAQTWVGHWVGHWVWQQSVRALLAVLLAFALPAGLIRALLYHLDGGDLADWS